MKVGLILECGSRGPDEQVCTHLAHRLERDVELVCVTLVNKPQLVAKCGMAAADLLRDGGERVIIVWDLYPAWAQSGATPCRGHDREEILRALHSMEIASPSVYLVCIEEELEAWLLADERALAAILSTPAHPVRVPRQRRPERVHNPKAMLLRLFQQNGKGRYNDMVHAVKIVEAMPDLHRIRQFASFVHFAEKFTGRLFGFRVALTGSAGRGAAAWGYHAVAGAVRA